MSPEKPQATAASEVPPFSDYTEWQRGLFNDMTVDEIADKASAHWKERYG